MVVVVEDPTVDQYQYQDSTTTETEEEEDLATTVFDSDTRVLDMDISEEGDEEVVKDKEEKEEKEEEEEVVKMAETVEERHQSLASMEKAVNICHRCGKSFSSYSKLKSHLTENWISSLGKETCRCCCCCRRTVNKTVVNTNI